MGDIIGGVTGYSTWATLRQAAGTNNPDTPPLVTGDYNREYPSGNYFLKILVLFLVAMAVVGDLMESLVKRSAGVKDSSGLLPGHGGVLDRVDALLPVLPIGMMLVTV